MGRLIILSLPFVCTQPHAYAYGGAAQLEVGSLPVSVSWPSALHCHPCLTHCSSRQRPQPDPRTLDEYTPRQYWPANFISLPYYYYYYYINNANNKNCSSTKRQLLTWDPNEASESSNQVTHSDTVHAPCGYVNLRQVLNTSIKCT